MSRHKDSYVLKNHPAGRFRWAGVAHHFLGCMVYGVAVMMGAELAPGALASNQATHTWKTAAPESQGMDSARLESLWKSIGNSTALLVIRNDQVVFERYAAGYSRSKPHYTASMAKALVGGVSLMVAMSDGLIQPDDPACLYVPQWRGDPLKKAITIRHLATHTSGIEDAESDDLPHEQLTGWKGDFWKRLAPPNDPFTLARDAAPVLEPPGTQARYSNPGMAMLSYCVTASLRGKPDDEVRSLLKRRVMDRIGVPEAEWSIGYGTSTRMEGLALVANWGGGAYSPNALACVGRLMLRKGDWDGKPLISPDVMNKALQHAGLPNASGLAWWVNRRADGNRAWKDAPPDAFAGAGAGHQLLLVVPSLQLIVVRNGERLGSKEDFDTALDHFFMTPLMQTFQSQNTRSRSASPVIQQLEWAPQESILRLARGSDNWPLTWADDDALYGAYGDGNGFEPFLPVKLSLGFAKVLGNPPETDSAYRTSDSMVLARVPKTRIRDRDAYEFLEKLDEGESPVWTLNLNKRGSVLTRPGRCYRPSVSYNAGLQRYLMVCTVPGANSRNSQGQVDTRFSGGLDVCDAPEPWGPWTEAYSTSRWDVGPGDSASFPTK